MSVILLLVGAVLCVAFYLYVFFTAEKPRKGTLEWIAMEEKPQMTRLSLHKLKPWDILWCAVSIAMVAASQYGILSVYANRQSFNLWSANIFVNYVLPQTLTALLVYTFSKLLTGNVFCSVLGAAMLAFVLPVGNEYLVLNRMSSVFIIAAGLFLYIWFACDHITAWCVLVLSAVLLGLGTYLFPPVILCAIPWLIVVLIGEAIRINKEDVSPAHLLLTLLVGIGALYLTATLVQLPMYLQQAGAFHAADLISPQLHSVLWQRLQAVWQDQRYDLFFISDFSSVMLGIAFIFFSCFHCSSSTDHNWIPLMWTLLALLALMFSPLDFIVPQSGIILAYLISRLFRRNYPGAAYVVGPIPVLLTLIPTIYTLWR